MAKMNAEQIVNLWISAHGIQLTDLQKEKLLACFELVAEGYYKLGREEAFKEAAEITQEIKVGPGSTS